MKTNPALSALNAVSPLDGRYASRCEPLRPLLSEAGFMAHRVEVELAWLIGLSEAGLAELKPFSAQARARLQAIVTNFQKLTQTVLNRSNASPITTSKRLNTG